MFFYLVVIGIGIGALASLFGIGGGFLLVPTMILLLDMETHLVVGTVSLVILFMSLSSSIAYARQKRIDFLVTGILSIASVIGATIGAYTTQLVTGKFILVSFGVVESILAITLGVKKIPQEKQGDKPLEIPENKKWYIIYRHKVDRFGNHYYYKANLLLAAPFSFLAGFLSSMLGIGGGTLYIQIFVFICGMSIHMAIASSMFTIFISRIAGTLSFSSIGQVDYLVAIAFGIGVVLGAQVGAFISKKIHSRYLKPMASIMIVIIALRMIYFALVQT